MGKKFKPNFPFDCALKLLIPQTTMVKGVAKKTFPEPKDVEKVFFASFKSYGGTENFSNDVYTVFDTAIIETWFDPAITTDCQIYDCETGKIYEVITAPEDIDRRHQFLQFKIQRVGGKA